MELSLHPDLPQNMSNCGLSASFDQAKQDIVMESTDEKSKDSSAPDHSFIALGVLRVLMRTADAGDSMDHPQAVMRNINGTETLYPCPLLVSAERKGWIKTQAVLENQDVEAAGSTVRVYILPEDVDRGHRGSLKDFKKVLKFLLNHVDRSIDAWNGIVKPWSIEQVQSYSVHAENNEESLFYIFNTLKSPEPKVDAISSSVHGYHSLCDVMEDEIMGLKTKLYPYQRRSVAAMVQKEADPAKFLDARLRQFTDNRGRTFYLDSYEGTILQSPSLYTEPQGGILAETMGYGKTLICLSLILATRGHYPKVPPGRVDSFAYEPRRRVGSLLAMAARRTKHEGLPWKTMFNLPGYQFDAVLEELGKYERAYAEPIFTPTTPGRKGKRQSYNVVRLCSATLVVVPPNLLVQWQQEIVKHVEDGALDVLVIDLPSKAVPSWQELLKYDVVLITKSRFEQEYRDDDLNQGKSKRGEQRYTSPLTEVRWLRVICDEGHGFAGSSCRTNAMAMLDKMFIERRWVVSGTPSSTLHGVEVGLSTTTLASGTVSSHDNDLRSHLTGRRASISRALLKSKAPSAHAQEAKDLERLRLIVVNFLRLQPWANQRGSDAANWKRYLAPTLRPDGRRIASPLLRDVLQTLIIRHRIEDIDTDLTLPALHSKVVYLTPSYHDKLAINMFTLVLVANFVTSEREDEDYMFHPKNRHKFDLLINNLRQASFHWVGFTEQNVRDALKTSNEYMDQNYDKVSDEDGALLTEGIMNAERALNDPGWVAFSKLHEMGVYAEQFPEHAVEAWALDQRASDPVLLGTVQAREVQKFYKDRLKKGVQDPLSGLAGVGIKAMKVARDRAEEELQAKSKSKAVDSEKQQLGTSDEPKLKAPSSSATLALRSPRNDMKVHKVTKVVQQSVPRKRRLDDEGDDHDNALMDVERETQILTTHSQPPPDIPPTQILGFTSSKLSYLISQILIHSPGSKSIVFYSGNNTAFWIAEALELVRVPHRIYASTLSVAQRNAYLSLFNTDDSIRVLLMDLKQASHGLHIASANRVYMVAPIWDKGVESQAVKRAHRIGQTKDVYVETLVLKGTFEEEMIKRRHHVDSASDIDADPDTDMQDADDNRLYKHTSPRHSTTTSATGNGNGKRKGTKTTTKSLLDDHHMVNVLKNIRFLKFSPRESDPDTHPDARCARLDPGVPSVRKSLFGLAVTPPSYTSSSSPHGLQGSHGVQGDRITMGNRGMEKERKRGRVGFVTPFMRGDGRGSAFAPSSIPMIS